jgi:protein ImuB
MFVCIYVPDFPVQALLRESKAAAVYDGPESLLKVVACNQAARSAGVYVGMTKLQAEACGVNVIKRVQKREEIAQSELLDCAYHFSPDVEVTDAGTIIIDMAGSERLLGTGKTIAQIILGEVTGRGFESHVSLASNPDTAHYAARGFKGITVIDPGDEARRLSTLPVEILGVEEDVLDTLHAWGIRTFKALASLPTVPLTERLGQYGLHLQRLAQGAVVRELVPAALPEAFDECTELEEPVELLEPLAFVLNCLLEQLLERLIERSLATDQIEIILTLEVHCDREINAPTQYRTLATYQRTIKLPVPTQDAKVLLKLAQLDLAAHPPDAPVKKVRIEVKPARVRFTQAGLFQPLAPEPAKLEITMARLRAVVGEADTYGRQRVGYPALLDSHRPDHFHVVLPCKHRDVRPSACLALRRFRPGDPGKGRSKRRTSACLDRIHEEEGAGD